MEFEGKVVIITGAGDGIGRECAYLFAQEGAAVIAADINAKNVTTAAQALLSKGWKAESYEIDVRDVSALNYMAEYTAGKYGTVHILVNNAAIYRTTPVEDITEEAWDEELSINIKAGFFLAKAVAPYMKKQRYGKIINLSSVAARCGGLEAGTAYVSSKAGIIGMTKSLALKFAIYGINVNCVAPGPTFTRMISGFDDKKLERIKNSIPLGKYGTPNDIAQAVVFLASDKAGFITGTVLDVNGGMYLD
jgi:3-oxoacyl-[acyl-carrier protein] reductase